jgi:hypothetical protein
MAELFRRQQTSSLASPWGAGGSYCHIAVVPRQPPSRFDGDSMGKNTARSNMAGYR